MKRIFDRLSAETRIILGSVAIYALLLWAAPLLALSSSIGILGLTITLVLARLVCALAATPRRPERSPEWDGQMVSIHIATYSEPPEVVMATLDSLATMTYPHYEVIVLDNNTPDPALYEPIRKHCRKLGDKFRFYHYDGVEGAKAGALNISLSLADPTASVILVLDADYEVQPDILQAGLPHFASSQTALVQFPQAYRNSDVDCGLTWDYKLFFDVYMNLANRYDTVLSTGTVAFVRRDALVALGGWTGETLTEDAELGLRLHRIGYHGVYVPESVAAGLMPTDLRSLRAQRRRWILGNAQSLVRLWREPDIGLLRKLVMSLQLTAWASPLFLSAVTFLTSAMMARLTENPVAPIVVAISTMSIMWYLAGTMAFFVVAVARQGHSVVTAFRALLAHLGMQWEASLSWCELFVDSDKSFVRTDKVVRAPEIVALTGTLALSLLVCGIGFDILRCGGCPWTAFACSLSSLVLTASGYLRWNLHDIRTRTVMLQASQAPEPFPVDVRLVTTRSAPVAGATLAKLGGSR